MIHYFMTNFTNTSSKEVCLFSFTFEVLWTPALKLSCSIRWSFDMVSIALVHYVFILEELCEWLKTQLCILDFTLKYMLKCGSHQCRCPQKMTWLLQALFWWVNWWISMHRLDHVKKLYLAILSYYFIMWNCLAGEEHV